MDRVVKQVGGGVGFSEVGMRELLESLASGGVTVGEVMEGLKNLPYEEVGGCATVDHHREIRTGFSEVIFCAGKTAEQVALIAESLASRSSRILGTRASVEQFEAARARVPGLKYHASARAIYLDRSELPKRAGVVVVAAGTSDLAVADEAAITLEMMGHEAKRITDVGVAGLHRLLPRVAELREANVVICVAGMEGALPSVVAGLIPTPVIAVPTSVGYGANFGGLAALLAMLNSCASGIAVVNIDNGYGAGVMAAAINAKIWEKPGARSQEPEGGEKQVASRGSKSE
jgi:NCAIR mutase (PurE)-related protein